MPHCWSSQRLEKMLVSDNRSITTVETPRALTTNVPLQIDFQTRVARDVFKAPRLLWVDDTQTLLSLYKSIFESLGFEVLAISSPREALNHAWLANADVAILDYEMPEMDGGQLADLLKAWHPTLPVILYSGCVDLNALHCDSVDAFCAKSAPREELLTTIQRLLPKPCKSQGTQCPGPGDLSNLPDARTNRVALV